jgi:RHS repeat-associated protein
VLTYYHYDPSGRLMAFDRAGVRYFVQTDQVGTPRVVTDSQGNIVKNVRTSAFGEVLSDSAPTFKLHVGYAGGISDSVTGLVRFGYRDYEPVTGRWTARDPILFAGGQGNLYVYVGNSVVSSKDSNGLWVVQACIGAAIGAGINAGSAYAQGG